MLHFNNILFLALFITGISLGGSHHYHHRCFHIKDLFRKLQRAMDCCHTDCHDECVPPSNVVYTSAPGPYQVPYNPSSYTNPQLPPNMTNNPSGYNIAQPLTPYYNPSVLADPQTSNPLNNPSSYTTSGLPPNMTNIASGNTVALPINPPVLNTPQTYNPSAYIRPISYPYPTSNFSENSSNYDPNPTPVIIQYHGTHCHHPKIRYNHCHEVWVKENPYTLIEETVNLNEYGMGNYRHHEVEWDKKCGKFIAKCRHEC
ncbi:uncharacterized protein LOC126843151 [Adelges cooleyi]|uniref:uncharacterized protein LOC126843151 n=1 Tax=Adelges cooleyi TaxID=133065 RepID=UPI00217FEB47|nr:uncharacterized protein LOC126843151 [Adelges cooleyi]XP_050436469.1 uncharacterized protein LOC126843151 [Adelges cooleyi]